MTHAPIAVTHSSAFVPTGPVPRQGASHFGHVDKHPAALPTMVFTSSDAMRPTVTPLTTLARPAPPAGRTSLTLVASQPVLDAKCRIGLGKVTRTVDLHAGDQLKAIVSGAVVRITGADTAAMGSSSGLRVDSQHRLTLTPGLCFTLGVRPGDQVQAIADPATGEVTLMSLAVALRQLVAAAGGAA